MKKIDIQCNDKSDFFYKYITLLNPLIGLTNVERLVLSQLLMWNSNLDHVPQEERDLLVFSKSIRSKILQSLDISRASLDNQFTSLRKKGVLKGNSINPAYMISYDTHGSLLVNFKLNNND